MASLRTGKWATAGRKSGLVVLAGLATAILVAGCGVRGAPELTQAEKARVSKNAAANKGQPEDGANRPRRGFILDGLLR